jgi:hypothetical protein
MNKEFIPYQQALALKELGFDEPCMSSRDMNNGKGLIQIPLYQQAFRWFREKYELSSWIYNSDTSKYFYTILDNGRIVKSHKSSNTYEEAELACLNKLIEIVKNK